ncbi:hypothetical protein SLNWT_1145 [Streptomyces albus]|uniref:Uncharacterized protein n=1 Tax=Streptomyces albus (strain ATCC 21838 / DSM 41398 / FERM P-419 / JCM 4703 / NBRC 107858) TaxID=1081613 RepID=A0A0B5ERY4_STRA4|nr:hypothetical protein SLNWT_1145 [Streptomyces albus]AOU75836.1 hypothetical protein SLNHY_1145 [Streptomyces albus]
MVALRGDPGVPGWRVIGHYAHALEAGRALPPPVPPGVLRARPRPVVDTTPPAPPPRTSTSIPR